MHKFKKKQKQNSSIGKSAVQVKYHRQKESLTQMYTTRTISRHFNMVEAELKVPGVISSLGISLMLLKVCWSTFFCLLNVLCSLIYVVKTENLAKLSSLTVNIKYVA